MPIGLGANSVASLYADELQDTSGDACASELITLCPARADQPRRNAAELLAAFVKDNGDDGVLAGHRGVGGPVRFGHVKLARLLNRFSLRRVFARLLAGQIARAKDDLADFVGMIGR